jgi:hypothetical protein
MLPATVSVSTFSNILIKVPEGAPNLLDSAMIHSDSAALAASPTPGTSPINGSRPKRQRVPGIRNSLSSKRANRLSRFKRFSDSGIRSAAEDASLSFIRLGRYRLAMIQTACTIPGI